MAHYYPHFLIVGMMKAGTTTLYHHLTSHPKIVPAVEKELHYFTRDYPTIIKPERWGMEYAEMLKVNGDKTLLYGEASPSYICVPERIYAFNPECKIIISLRDPVTRMISQMRQYNMHNHLQKGESYLSFIKKKFEDFENVDVIRDSIYADRIENFLNVFPAENTCLISYEYFTKNIQTSVDSLFEFLGVSSVCVNEMFASSMTNPICEQEERGVIKIVESVFDNIRGQVARLLERRAVTLIPNDLSCFEIY